ncbi:hypothetical protein ACHQM5_005200 [Ranunculus cassubicifolius]
MENSNQCSPDQKVVDRISILPESIRNHIVSFLPMKDSITTSTLSKSWRNICSSLYNLDFDQQLFDEMSSKKTSFKFKDYVSQFIGCRDGSNVHSFRLVVDDSIVPYIQLWILYAVQHNVKRLEVIVRSGNLDSLPCSLFTSRTLIVMCLSDIHLELPVVVEFPLLKVLDLRKVRWSDVSQTNQLISNCPRLESLVLILCSWNKFNNSLVISSPKLKMLVSTPAHDLQEVKISCPDLYDCQYSGYPPDISSETLSSLLIATLRFIPLENFQESQNVTTQRVTKIFLGLHNVLHLVLGQFTLESLSKNQDLFTHIQIQLCSIKLLQLDVFSAENQVEFVASLLSIFPNLQILHVSFKEPGPLAWLLNLEGHYQPKTSSDLGALFYITIKELKGNDNELYLVRHLLKNAKVLLNVEISYSRDLDEDEPRRSVIGKKIEQFVKASRIAIISFV